MLTAEEETVPQARIDRCDLDVPGIGLGPIGQETGELTKGRSEPRPNRATELGESCRDNVGPSSPLMGARRIDHDGAG